ISALISSSPNLLDGYRRAIGQDGHRLVLEVRRLLVAGFYRRDYLRNGAGRLVHHEIQQEVPGVYPLRLVPPQFHRVTGGGKLALSGYGEDRRCWGPGAMPGRPVATLGQLSSHESSLLETLSVPLAAPTSEDACALRNVIIRR